MLQKADHDGILKELKSVLEDADVTKVIHDCRQDSAALWYQFGIKLNNIFDTQVSALMQCIQCMSVKCSAPQSNDLPNACQSNAVHLVISQMTCPSNLHTPTTHQITAELQSTSRQLDHDAPKHAHAST